MRWPLAVLSVLALAGCSAATSGASPGPSPGSASVGQSSSSAQSSSAQSSSAQSSSAQPSPAPSATTPAPTRVVAHLASWRLPTAVAREAVATRGRALVVAGGLVAGDASTATVLALDPVTGDARPGGSLPVPVHDTVGVSLGGRALVIGGGNATEQDVVQATTPRGWSVVGHLPQARSDLSAAVVGHRVLVLGGYDGQAVAVPSILASVDGRHWRRIGHLPVPVRYAASTVAHGDVWLFGGERAGVMQTAVQRVDPSGRSRVVAHLPAPLGHATALTLGGRILLVGGRTGTTSLTDRMWWFDPGAGTFRAAGRLPVPLADSAVAIRGDGAWLLGGESPSVTDRVVRLVAH